MGKEEKDEKKDGRITVEISGEVLRRSMALRAKREKVEGKPVSLAKVVRDAVTDEYKRVVEGEEEIE
jgi:hypothetical protein